MAAGDKSRALFSTGFTIGQFGVINNIFYIRNITTGAIHVFAQTGAGWREVKVITLSIAITVGGVQPLPTGDILILNTTNARLDLFDANGNFIKTIGTGIITTPVGMGIRDNRMVIVNAGLNTFYLYNVDYYRREVTLRSTVSLSGLGTAPRSCTFSNAGDIIICFDDTTTVSLVTSDGNFLASAPTATTAATNPTGVAHDPLTGDIFVGGGTTQNIYQLKFPQ